MAELEKEKRHGHETPGPANNREDTVDDVHGKCSGNGIGAGDSRSTTGTEGCAGGQRFSAELVAADDAKAIGDWNVDGGALAIKGGADAQGQFTADAGAGSAAVSLMNRAGEGGGDCPDRTAAEADESGDEPDRTQADANSVQGDGGQVLPGED